MATSASINNIPLDIENVSDCFEKSLAIREFPYSDRPQVEDLGQKVRVIKVRAWFTDAQYLNHENLEALTARSTPVVFVHPDYGSLTGYVRQVSTNHDSSPDTAVCDFEFVVSDYARALAPPIQNVVTAVETAAADGLDNAQVSLDFGLSGELGAEGKKIADAPISPLQNIISQLSGLSAKAQAWASQVNAVVGTVEGTLADIELPASSLISTIDFAEDLPGRVVGAFANVAARCVAAAASLAGAPDRLLQSVEYSLTSLSDTLFPQGNDQASLMPAWLAATGLVMAMACAGGFDADQQARDANAALAAAQSFDDAGNYTKIQPPSPVMNVTRIETALAIARGRLERALAADRSNQALADGAAALLAHASGVKLKIGSLKTIEVMYETPLFLVLLAAGLTTADAESIMAINPQIQNPNAVQGEVTIYVN